MRCRGRIASWNDERGFGFIQPEEGGERVFVHIKSFNDRRSRPTVSASVEYELTHDAGNRPRAVCVSYLDGTRARASSKGDALVVLVVCAALLFAAYLAASEGLALAALAWYLIASVLTFAVYARDKKSAQRGRWRTPEQTLHLLSLLGGWPGALLAQRFLRHKTRKLSFRIVFWLTAALNLAALAWLSTQAGSFFVSNRS